jgi:hypothetical protein
MIRCALMPPLVRGARSLLPATADRLGVTAARRPADESAQRALARSAQMDPGEESPNSRISPWPRPPILQSSGDFPSQ